MAINAVVQGDQQVSQHSLELLSEPEANVESQATSSYQHNRNWHRTKYLFLEGKTLESVYRESVMDGTHVSGWPSDGDRILSYLPGIGEVVYRGFGNGVSCKVL